MTARSTASPWIIGRLKPSSGQMKDSHRRQRLEKYGMLPFYNCPRWVLKTHLVFRNETLKDSDRALDAEYVREWVKSYAETKPDGMIPNPFKHGISESLRAKVTKRSRAQSILPAHRQQRLAGLDRLEQFLGV
jgi:hypothetical protein